MLTSHRGIQFLTTLYLQLLVRLRLVLRFVILLLFLLDHLIFGFLFHLLIFVLALDIFLHGHFGQVVLVSRRLLLEEVVCFLLCILLLLLVLVEVLVDLRLPFLLCIFVGVVLVNFVVLLVCDFVFFHVLVVFVHFLVVLG